MAFLEGMSHWTTGWGIFYCIAFGLVAGLGWGLMKWYLGDFDRK